MPHGHCVSAILDPSRRAVCYSIGSGPRLSLEKTKKQKNNNKGRRGPTHYPASANEQQTDKNMTTAVNHGCRAQEVMAARIDDDHAEVAVLLLLAPLAFSLTSPSPLSPGCVHYFLRRVSVQVEKTGGHLLFFLRPAFVPSLVLHVFPCVCRTTSRHFFFFGRISPGRE